MNSYNSEVVRYVGSSSNVDRDSLNSATTNTSSDDGKYLYDENQNNIDTIGKLNDDYYEATTKVNDFVFDRTTTLLNSGVECGTLNELIEYLHRAFDSDVVNIEFVSMLMSSYKSNPAEWLKYAKFDKYRYTRNLVDSGNGKYNLMTLCWGEGHGSSIHDHSNSHCFMKMLAGSLCETRFEWPQNESSPPPDAEQEMSDEPAMREISRNVLNTNEVCYINDSIGLHRVENLSYTDRAVSLHLYCPPFNSCHIFNQHTGHKMEAQVTFWSISGEKQNRRTRTMNRDSSPDDN